MNSRDHMEAVRATYARPDLGAAILAGLRAAGKDPAAPTPDDLAPVDHFHTGGRAATMELARRVPVAAPMQVLDVGGGIGGAGRLLASQFGCRVTILDLTEAYCQTGTMLTRLTGLSDRVDFRHGDALNLPFADHSFDLVWTQHATMNIAQKSRLYAELGRVLRPSGRLAFHEVMAGPNGPVSFPVPWAADSATSFLSPPDEVRSLLARDGWRELDWSDATEASLAFFEARVPRAEQAHAPLPPLGLHLLLGDRFRDAMQNMVRNLREGCITVIQAVYARA